MAAAPERDDTGDETVVLRLVRELMAQDDDARGARLEQLAREDPDAHAEVTVRLAYGKGELTAPLGDLPTLVARRRPREPVPERIGGYQIEALLGEGGQGRVYLAYQPDLGRRVALKVVPPHTDLRRFEREARAAAALEHQGIVRVYEVGEDDGRPYIAMSFVDGQSLAQRVDDGPLEPREAARLLRQLASAIAFAHDAGIVHRDLKPGNILLDADGQPLITDFGLAKRVDDDNETTRPGEVVGTVAYMAPEQIGGDSAPPVDIYALGATLYHLLTGRPPFQAGTLEQSLLLVRQQQPVALRRLNPGVPCDLETICLACLEKQPAKRYATAHALADDLGRFLDDQPIRRRPLGPIGRALRWSRRRPWLAGLLLALAALVATMVLSGMALLQSDLAARARQEARRPALTREADLGAFAVGQRLDALALALEQSAALPELHESLGPDAPPERAQATLAAIGRRWNRGAEADDELRPYAAWYLFDDAGRMLARWKPREGSAERRYDDRDYFRAARQAPGATRVSRVYRGRNDPAYRVKFALSRGVGDDLVLAAAIPSSSDLGLPALRGYVLVSAIDPSSRDEVEAQLGPLPSDLVVIVHRSFDERGQHLAPVPAELARALTAAEHGTLTGYRDPATGQRCDAGFARVRDTPFVVLAQSPALGDTGWTARLGRWLLLGAALAALVLGAITLRRALASTR